MNSQKPFAFTRKIIRKILGRQTEQERREAWEPPGPAVEALLVDDASALPADRATLVEDYMKLVEEYRSLNAAHQRQTHSMGKLIERLDRAMVSIEAYQRS